jgi:hypothetical protein
MGEEWVEKRVLNACPQQAHRFNETLLFKKKLKK